MFHKDGLDAAGVERAIADWDETGLAAVVKNDKSENQRQREGLAKQHQKKAYDIGGPPRDGEVSGEADDDGGSHERNRERAENCGGREQADANRIAVDGNGTQTVNHQTGKSHLGLAGEAFGAVDRNGGARQLHFHDSGGVVVPQLRRNNEWFERCCRKDAEVSDVNVCADEQAMDRAIELVEEREERSFLPPFALGEDDLPAALADEFSQQNENIGRIVLAVGVHDDDRALRIALLEMHQAGGKSALMAQIPLEVQDPDSFQVAWSARRELSGNRVRRGVVDEENLRRYAVFSQSGVYLRDQ